MVDKKLYSYIEKCLSMNVGREEILSNLLSKGWKELEIQETFQIVDSAVPVQFKKDRASLVIVAGFPLAVIILVILSFVVIVIDSAQDRHRGSTAVVKANLSGVRAQAELYYDRNNNSYIGLCDKDSGIQDALAAIKDRGSEHVVCRDDEKWWYAEADFVVLEDTYFCVDSQGGAEETKRPVDELEISCPKQQ